MKGVFLLQDIRDDLLLNPQNLIFYYQVNGWFAGGHNGTGSLSIIRRINYATDSNTSSLRSYLSTARRGVAGVHDANYGWWSGETNQCDRMSYMVDTTNSIARCFLQGIITRAGYATDSNNYGWWAAGYNTYYLSQIQRIVYATDTIASTIRGNMYTGMFKFSSSCNTTNAWFAGGALQSGVSYVTTVTRLTYSTDTVTPSTRGNLSVVMADHSGMGNLTDGWLGGGWNGSYTTTIYRINYATDTASSTAKGNRLVGLDQIGTSCNNTDGWWSGGRDGGYFSNVERTTFAYDTNVNLAKGLSTVSCASCGGL